jgi:hypothetical protein
MYWLTSNPRNLPFSFVFWDCNISNRFCLCQKKKHF